jgi:hypothetical protein
LRRSDSNRNGHDLHILELPRTISVIHFHAAMIDTPNRKNIVQLTQSE